MGAGRGTNLARDCVERKDSKYLLSEVVAAIAAAISAFRIASTSAELGTADGATIWSRERASRGILSQSLSRDNAGLGVAVTADPTARDDDDEGAFSFLIPCCALTLTWS